MINDYSSANIYFNVVVRINKDYEDLLTNLKSMDTMAGYLSMFELSLSLGCTMPLWEIDVYKERSQRLTPLPADPYKLIPFSEFCAWLAIYEIVMRDQGLVGTKPTYILGAE